MNDENKIKVRYEAPYEEVFLGEDVGLLVQGCIAEVVAHEISKPGKTLIAEDGATYVSKPHSMRGAIYGKGPVRRSYHEAFITLGGAEHSFVPHGNFEELSKEELVEYEPATWKFTFAYSLKPCGCSGK